MADIKFSQFTENITPALTDEVVGLQSGTNKRTTLEQIQTLFSQTFVGISASGAISVALDSTINGIKIGRGGGNFATNTVFAKDGLFSNVVGEYNLAVGYEALYANASSYNTAIGYYALRSNTSGYGNTGIGAQALYQNTTGRYNLAIGLEVMAFNTTGLNNVALGGYDTMLNSTTADSCVAIGYAAMYSNISATNLAIGSNALYTNQTGNDNTVIGRSAAYFATSGGNVVLGAQAAYDLTTGANNLILGRLNRGVTTGSNNTMIGNNLNVGNVSGNIILAQGDGTVKLRYDATAWAMAGSLAITGGLSTTTDASINGVSSFLGHVKTWSRFLDIGSTTNNGVVGIQLGIFDGGNNRRVGLFLDDNNGTYGFNTGASSGPVDFIIQNNGITNFVCTYTGLVGIGISVPSLGYLNIRPGTASVAPIVLAAGTNTTTAVNGSIEYNGTNFFITRTGAVRENLLSASAVTTEALTSDTTLTINYLGTTYKVLAKA